MNKKIKIYAAVWLFSILGSTQGALAEGSLAPLTAVTVDNETILANDHGLTVYVFDKDSGEQSNCYDACAKAWPPVLVPANTHVTSPVGTTARKDGSVQVTYQGHPVYTYVGDGGQGETNGDGLGGIWHLVKLQENEVQ